MAIVTKLSVLNGFSAPMDKPLKTLTLHQDNLVVSDRYSDFVHLLETRDLLPARQRGTLFINRSGYVWDAQSTQTIQQVTGLGLRSPSSATKSINKIEMTGVRSQPVAVAPRPVVTNAGADTTSLIMLPAGSVIIRFIDGSKTVAISSCVPDKDTLKSTIADLIAPAGPKRNAKLLASLNAKGSVWLQTSDQLRSPVTFSSDGIQSFDLQDKATFQTKLDSIKGKQNVLPMLTVVLKKDLKTTVARRFGFLLFLAAAAAFCALVMYPWMDADM